MGRNKALADVTVTFKDGEVKTYRISAGPNIGSYLARDSATTGVLSLWNRDQSFGIPVANIRDWAINIVPEETEERASWEISAVPEEVEKGEGE